MPFIEGSLRLVLSPYDLTITTFSDNNYPRVVPQFPEATESTSGTIVLSGVSYTPKHFWNITCDLYETDFNTLDSLYQYAWLNDTEIVIHDYTREIRETTQSRNTAIDASVSNDGTLDSYYARFRALFNSDLSAQKIGPTNRCSFQLRETTIVSP